MNEPQEDLFSHSEFEPFLLLQDPRVNFDLSMSVLPPAVDGEGYCLRCRFDTISPSARAQLRYRVRVYGFGPHELRFLEGPLSMEGRLTIWSQEQGTLEIFQEKVVQHKIVFLLKQDGCLTFHGGMQPEEKKVEAVAFSKPYPPGTLGSCLQALCEDMLEEVCPRCRCRHPRYLVFNGERATHPALVLSYHTASDVAQQWLLLPCAVRDSALRNPQTDSSYAQIIDFSQHWSHLCPPSSDGSVRVQKSKEVE